MAGRLAGAPLLLRPHQQGTGLRSRAGTPSRGSIGGLTRKLLVVAAVAIAIALFFAVGGPRYLTVEDVKAQQAAIESRYQAQPRQTGAAFFAAYVPVTAFSPPPPTALTPTARPTFRPL